MNGTGLYEIEGLVSVVDYHILGTWLDENLLFLVKGKERKLDLYSAPLWEARLCSAQAWSHSFYAATTPYLSLPRKAFTRRRYNDSDNSRLIAAHYSFIIDPERMKGWVGLVGWSTFSGRFTFTHINGYPSAAGTLQARESWPVRNRRSTTQLHRQPCNLT